NVLTGETGAGKSILLQALDLVLGGKPESELVRGGADEATVEALFGDVPANVRELLAAGGITVERRDDLVIRRVIARGGRTRAYVNNSLGSLTLLRDLAPHLLRVYGQHEHQALRRTESHRELLDGIGRLTKTVDEMAQRHARFAKSRDAVDTLRAEQAASAERAELLHFQAGELERAALVPGEEESLLAQRMRLVHAERLARVIGGVESGVYSGEQSATDALGRALAALKEAERLDPALLPTRQLVDTALVEVQEA